MGVEMKDVKVADKQIDKDLSHNIIDENEVKSTDSAADFLKKTSTDKNIEDKISKEAKNVFDKANPKIKNAILKYFPIGPDKMKSVINKLNSDQASSYIRLINTITREDKDNQTKQNIIEGLTSRINWIKDDDKLMADAKDNEKKNINSQNLEWLLAMEPSHEVAIAFFEKNEAAYNAIFDNPDKWAYNANPKWAQKNFQDLMTIYLAGSDVWAKDITLTSLSIKPIKDNSTYMKWLNTIQIKFTTTSNKTEQTKDIAFGPKTEVMYEARANSVKESPEYKTLQESLTQIKSKEDVGTLLISLNTAWSYATFKNLLNDDQNSASTLKNLFANDLFNQIDTFDYKNDNKETKLNGFYGAILDVVIKKWDGPLLNTYLSYVNENNMNHLGTSKEARKANYDKLLIFSGTIDESDPNYASIKDKISKITSKIVEEQKQDFMKDGIDAITKTFGWDILLKIIDLFGGKWFIRNICNKFGINYEKYFWQIEKLYQDKYWLNTEQKTALNNMYTNYGNPATKIQKIALWTATEVLYDQATILKNAKKEFGESATKFNLLDPRIVTKAINELNTKNPGTIKTDISNLTIKEKINGTTKYKMNDKVEFKDEDERKTIIEQIITSPTSKANVQKAAIAIIASNGVYPVVENKNNNENIAASNQENIDKQNMKKMESGADVAMYYGAYMMKGWDDLKYVISENTMPKEWDVTRNNPGDIENKDETSFDVNEKVTNKEKIKLYTVDAAWKATEGKTTIPAWQTLIIKEKKLVRLDKISLVKVSWGTKEGYIDQEKLEKSKTDKPLEEKDVAIKINDKLTLSLKEKGWKLTWDNITENKDGSFAVKIKGDNSQETSYTIIKDEKNNRVEKKPA